MIIILKYGIFCLEDQSELAKLMLEQKRWFRKLARYRQNEYNTKKQ